jgi:glutaredoxin
MEIARDPSDENIDHWFKYLHAKNEITRRLQNKLTEYSVQHESQPTTTLTQSIPISDDAKRFRLRLYFDSKCPHCENMIETLKALSQRGYFIELKQVDSNTLTRSRIPFPVTAATSTEMKQYKIESVPVLLVGDLKARTYFKIQGYQTEANILKTLSDISEPNQGAN